jgi:hypothetical protein
MRALRDRARSAMPSEDAQGSALFGAKLAGLLAQLRLIVPATEAQSR